MNYFTMPGMPEKWQNLVTVENIIFAVCEVLSVNKDELLGKCRKRKIVDARHIAIYFINKSIKLSCIKLGEYFNRDHSTILYSIQNVRMHMETEMEYFEKVKEVEKLIF